MKLHRTLCATIILAVFLLAVPVLHADITHKSMNEVKLGGPMKFIAKLFGWDGPRYTVDYYKGHKMRIDFLGKDGKKPERSEIIDLDNELMISIDHKKKKYTQMTFEEWRQMIRDFLAQHEEMMEEQSSNMPDDAPNMEINYNFQVNRTGEIEDINGFKAEKVIVTAESPMEGRDGQQGGMTVTSTHWVVEELYGSKEMEEFAMLIVQKLGMNPEVEKMTSMTQMMVVSNPAAGAAFQQIKEAQEKVGGHSVKTITEVGQPGSTDGSAPDADYTGGGGGLLGKLGGKFMGGADNGGDETLFIKTISEKFAIERDELDPKMFEVPEEYKKDN